MSQKGLRVTVTVDLATVGNVVRDLVPVLQGAGLKVDEVLGLSGIVTGRVNPAKRNALALVPGVLAVEEEGSFNLPPPDADIM